MTFKNGTRVRVTGGVYKNNVGVVVDDSCGTDGVDFGEELGIIYFDPSNLSEVVAWLREDYSEWPDDTEKQEVEPSYYDFPGGVEVRQISAHLTGFGAQALQYVARATRLDGKNKGDVVSDLTKAIDFIRWEIERIEGANNG